MLDFADVTLSDEPKLSTASSRQELPEVVGVLIQEIDWIISPHDVVSRQHQAVSHRVVRDFVELLQSFDGLLSRTFYQI